MTKRIGFLISHPIQYYAPIFRELAKQCDLTVFFAHRQTAEQQANAGFGVAFDWDVDLLSGYESRFLTNIAPQPSTDRFDGCDTPAIAEAIEEGKFDAFVVPGWALKTYWQAVQACRRAGVLRLVRGDSQLGGQRGLMVRAAKSLAFPWVLRRFDRFLYVGERNRAYLRHYGVPDRKMFFSPHCVDNDAFAQAATAVPQRPPGRRRILFAGKLLARKHPQDMLGAAALLPRDSIEVVFAGSGELEPALRRFAGEAGLDTTFLGFVNQSGLPAVYASCDLLILPSDARETWGLVVNEAMACGTPAVVSDAVGCGPDLIEAGKTGAIFPLGDIPALSRAIVECLSLDRERTRRFLKEKMDVYSPATAARAIVAATGPA